MATSRIIGGAIGVFCKRNAAAFWRSGIAATRRPRHWLSAATA